MTVLAVATTDARTIEERTAPRRVVTRHVVNNGTTTRVVAPARQRTVVRRSYNGGYYGGGYHPYYYGGGPTVSVGIGGGYGYGYPYAYGYPGYAYGYPYAYSGGYVYNDGYPYTTTTRTTYVTSNRDYYYSDRVVESVQARLADAGYYHGSIDGVMGPQTRSAVALWEARHQMEPDGNIDRTLLHSLGVS